MQAYICWYMYSVVAVGQQYHFAVVVLATLYVAVYIAVYVAVSITRKCSQGLHVCVGGATGEYGAYVVGVTTARHQYVWICGCNCTRHQFGRLYSLCFPSHSLCLQQCDASGQFLYIGTQMRLTCADVVSRAIALRVVLQEWCVCSMSLTKSTLLPHTYFVSVSSFCCTHDM